MKKKMLLKLTKVFSFLLLLIIIIGVLFLLDVLRVRTIEIDGVKSLNGIFEVSKKPIFLIDNQTLERRILKKNPSLLSVYVEKRFPNTLYIKATKTTAVAQLRVSEGYYLLSPESVIISKKREKSNGVATIKYFTKYPFESYNVTDVINVKEIQYASYFLSRMKAIKRLRVKSVDINHLFVIVFKGKTQEVWITTQKSKEEQFDTLRTILRDLNKSGVEFNKLDLRFSKPIVTLQK